MGKRKKSNLKWIKETLDLDKNHNWQSEPGNRIFVAGRGALRFDVPDDWHFQPEDNSFQFLDDKPPNDNIRLEASFNLLKPANWAECPLAPLLRNILKEEKRNVTDFGKIEHFKRQTARFVWTQIEFIDPAEDRRAYSRIAIGLGSNVQCLITMDYWVEDSEKAVPVWDTVMNSVVLGLFIRDPRTGFAFPD